MTMQDKNPNTIYLTPEYVDKADKIAAALSAMIGVPIKRSAVVRRALDDLFLAVCPTDKTDDVSVNQAIN